MAKNDRTGIENIREGIEVEETTRTKNDRIKIENMPDRGNVKENRKKSIVIVVWTREVKR